MALTDAMVVTYNGVTINVSRVELFERRPVYSEDDTQILYDHWHIGVVGLVNTNVNRGLGLLPPGNPPVGTLGPLGFKALGDRLLQQRKQLTVTYGSFGDQPTGTPNMVLQSPRQIPGSSQSFTMDEKNGPAPIDFKILEIHGTRTLVVYFEIETWQRRCTDYPHSILYHRWEASHEIDDEYITTRSVQGRAIFSAAMLNDPTLPTEKAPDDWRYVLFHAVPVGFQRKNIKVTADMDGLGVIYSFQDVEQVGVLTLAGNRGIVKLKVHHRSGHNTIQSMLPIRYVELEATATGLPTTQRTQLVNALVDVAAAYAFRKPQNAGWWESADLEVDCFEKKEATLRTRMETSGIWSAAVVGAQLGNDLFGAAVGGAVGGLPLDTGLNGSNNYKETLTPWAVAGYKATGASIRPPNSDGTRGTYTERLIAQILGGDCDFPDHIVDGFGNTTLGNYLGANALPEWTW